MKQIWFLRLISWSYNSTFSRNHCVHLASWLSSTFSGGNIQQLGQSPLFVPHSCIALLDPCPKDNIWPTESYFGSSDRCFAQATEEWRETWRMINYSREVCTMQWTLSVINPKVDIPRFPGSDTPPTTSSLEGLGETELMFKRSQHQQLARITA